MAFTFTIVKPAYASTIIYDTDTETVDEDDSDYSDDGGDAEEKQLDDSKTLAEQGEAINSLVENEMKDVDSEEIEEKISEKGSDVISWMQRAGVAICIGLFIVFALAAIIGGLSKKGIGPGLFGMVCTMVVCVAIIYGPEIMLWFKSWLAK